MDGKEQKRSKDNDGSREHEGPAPRVKCIDCGRALAPAGVEPATLEERGRWCAPGCRPRAGERKARERALAQAAEMVAELRARLAAAQDQAAAAYARQWELEAELEAREREHREELDERERAHREELGAQAAAHHRELVALERELAAPGQASRFGWGPVEPIGASEGPPLDESRRRSSAE